MTVTSFNTLQQSRAERGSLEYTPKFTVVSQHFWQEFCVSCFWYNPKRSSLVTIRSGNWVGQVMSQKWDWVSLETLSWELVWKCVLHEQWLRTSCAWWQSVWMLCRVCKLFLCQKKVTQNVSCQYWCLKNSEFRRIFKSTIWKFCYMLWHPSITIPGLLWMAPWSHTKRHIKIRND